MFVLVALVAALAWYDLRNIRSELVSARDTLDRAVNNPLALRTTEGRAALKAEVDVALQSVGAARRRAQRSVVLSASRPVPGLRAQRDGLLDLIDDSAAAATVGRDLLGQIDALAEQMRLRDGQVPLDALGRLAADVRAAGARIAESIASPARLWGPLGDARRRLDEVARSTASRLGEGADALDAARSFMGAPGPRRYLVALQNNAEMRDQGAVLAYAVIRFNVGRLSFERSGSVREIPLERPLPTALPQGTAEVFGAIQPTRLWQSVNATADFAWSGRAMVEMYGQATGEQVDGVIAIDVPGLAALLRVIGGVQVQTLPEPVTHANVARLLLHDVYEGLTPSSDPLRQERYAELTRAVVTRLTTESLDGLALGRELGAAATGGHLRLWSRTTGEEEVFERTGLGGGPATTGADRTFHLAVQNRTATKLDYYVKVSARQEAQLTPQGTAIVRTTVVIDNQAPVGQPPSYQLGPDMFTKKPGDYLAWVLLWGPAGAAQRGGVNESGLLLSQYVVDVAAGERRELTFDTVIANAIRDGRFQLRLVPQARHEPIGLQVRLRASGWDVEGATAWAGSWDAAKTLSWEVRR